MIWANVTKFGQNFIAPPNFLAGTPMVPLNNEHDGLQVRRNELALPFLNFTFLCYVSL